MKIEHVLNVLLAADLAALVAFLFGYISSQQLFTFFFAVLFTKLLYQWADKNGYKM